MLGRMREIAGECIETYAGIGKQAVQVLGGDADARDSFFRDAWMAWAGLGGKVIEGLYISAALADHAGRTSRSGE